MTPTRRKPRSLTVQSAGEALRDVAAGLPEPPAGTRLTAAGKRFWAGILASRLPTEWAPLDLVHAATLARTLTDLQAQQAALAREETVLTAKSGWPMPNPRLAIIDGLVRRSIQLTRLLQLHAMPHYSTARDRAASKAEALAANTTLGLLAEDDGLLARPRRPN